MIAFLAMLAAGAQTAPTAAPPAPAAPAADPVICHTPPAEVGTHMRPKPVCMKRSDWAIVDRQTQKELRNFGDRSSFDPGRAEGHGGPH